MTALPGFYSTLFTIAIPIVLQNFLQTFVNMLDTVMVGRLGATEIAAVGLGNQIFFILNMMLFGISSGGAIFVAQYWGKKDIAGIRRTLGITLTLSFALSLVFTAAALFFPRELISLYSSDERVIALGGGIVGRKARTLRRFLIVSMTSFIVVPLFLQDDNSSLG